MLRCTVDLSLLAEQLAKCREPAVAHILTGSFSQRQLSRRPTTTLHTTATLGHVNNPTTIPSLLITASDTHPVPSTVAQ